MSSKPSKLTLLRQIVKHVHFEPHAPGAVPITQTGLESLRMFVAKIGPAGMAGIRVEAAEPVNLLADSIFSNSTYQRGTTFPAVHKQLTDTIIENYAGKAVVSIDRQDVAFVDRQIADWFHKQVAVHEFYIPCLISPWHAAAFSIGPVRFSHVQDFAPVVQAETGALHELTFKPMFDLMARTRAQWIATVKIDGCTPERAQEIADLAVDVALAGLQVCLPEHEARHMARMTGRTMPTLGQAVSRSGDQLLSATINSEPGLTLGPGFLDNQVSAARQVLDSVGRRLDAYICGGGGALSRLDQAWTDAAYWFHEALAEPLDTIAVPKLETSLEVLLRAENVRGSQARVLNAIAVFYGKLPTDLINPHSQTTVQEFARGFVEDRSRILHGTGSTLTDSLRTSRPTVTELSRELLASYTVALDQYAAIASASDKVQAFLDFISARRTAASTASVAGPMPATP